MRGWLRRLFARDAAERRVLAAGGRRLRSGRGSAYVEFAFLAPLFLMMASLLIELATFWDASVMANHAAWQVGRIMKVKPDGKNTELFKIKALDAKSDIAKQAGSGVNDVIKLLNQFGDQRTLTTVMLMSGSSMGYTGVPGHEMGDLLSIIVKAPMEMLTDKENGLSKMLAEALAAKAPDLSQFGLPTGDLLSGLASQLLGVIAQPIFNAVAQSLLKPVSEWAQKTLNGIGTKISDALDQKDGSFSATKHYARNLQKAYQRVQFATVGKGKKGGPLVKVYTANEGDIQFLGATGTLRQPHVKGKAPGLEGQVAYVRVRWPMASDWLFPFFWGGDRSDKGVWATGHCLTLLEPMLKNEHLTSSNPTAYTPPAQNQPGEYQKVSDQIVHDLKIELFLMRYRNTREELYLSGNTSEGGLLTARHIQNWQTIAYGGKSYPSAYQESWSAAMGGVAYWKRGNAYGIVNGWLKGYPKREWLYYESANTQRERYLGTLGGLPSPVGWETTAAAKRQWEEALTLAQTHGQAAGLAAGLGARLESATATAQAAVKKLETMRAWLDGTIADLAKRVGETSGSAGIELDPDTMRNLSGDDLTDGEEEITPEALQKKWTQTYAELKALRDQINDVARDIGWECETIASTSANLSKQAKQVGDALKNAKKKNAKDKAFQTLGARLKTLHDAVGQLASVAGQLGPNVEKAMALEVQFAQKLNLKSAAGLDPRKLDWGAIAEKAAQGDGTGEADLGKENERIYGNDDGKGDGPWKR